MIKKILKEILEKPRKYTTKRQQEKIDSKSTKKANKILKEEEDKLNDIKDTLNKNLADIFNNKNVF